MLFQTQVYVLIFLPVVTAAYYFSSRSVVLRQCVLISPRWYSMLGGMCAWEQARMMNYFRRHAGAAKVMVVGLDGTWCAENPARVTGAAVGEFPDWLYDDDPWNDYAPLLNEPTVELAACTVGYQFGLYQERIRDARELGLAAAERRPSDNGDYKLILP